MKLSEYKRLENRMKLLAEIDGMIEREEIDSILLHIVKLEDIVKIESKTFDDPIDYQDWLNRVSDVRHFGNGLEDDWDVESERACLTIDRINIDRRLCFVQYTPDEEYIEELRSTK